MSSAGVLFLRFRRDAGRHSGFAHLYGTPRTAFLRGRYGQILRPSRHLPKFTNGMRGDPNVGVHLDPHSIWPAPKKHLERGDILRFVSHEGYSSLPDPTGGSRRRLSPPATGRRPVRSALLFFTATYCRSNRCKRRLDSQVSLTPKDFRASLRARNRSGCRLPVHKNTNAAKSMT
jgi:hypothetical protein